MAMAHCTHCDLDLNRVEIAPLSSANGLAFAANAWRRITGALRAWRRRRKLTQLHDLDDKMLRDIGVTRAELHRVTRLPLSVNAAVELQKLALSRRQQEFTGKLPR
ncbi:MAG: DUF1127 domain-containing protein [Pseudomonadota bacterium]